MDYHKITTYEEAKAFFKTLWRPMDSECVLNNLQKILNFVQSPAEEICFVNMQEKYLPFYYMIVLDNEFLQTTFVTDECKVVASEILRTLEANRNSFTWEIFFSRQIAGIPVTFKKVYTQQSLTYPRERFERPIRSEFKETWIRTTLKFIKSSRLVLKYPEMPRKEAVYLYKAILKQNEEDLGPDSPWAPVWEALNIFKLRYEYIVCLHQTAFEYLKYVYFEKVILQRKNPKITDDNPIEPLNINQTKLINDCNTNDDNNKKSINDRAVNDVLLPVFNHDDLIKTLLEMKFTKSGRLVSTLKVDNSSMPTETLKERFTEVKDVGDEPGNSENTTQCTNLNLSNDPTDIVTIAVDDKLDIEIEQCKNLNVTPSNKVMGVSRETAMLIDNDGINPELEFHGNKDADVFDDNENKDELEVKSQSNITDKNTVKDFIVDSNLTVENELHCNNEQSQAIESDVTNVALHDNTEMDVNDETTKFPCDDMDSINENPFIQQLMKVQVQRRPLYLREEEFIVIDENELKQTESNESKHAEVCVLKMAEIFELKQIKILELNQANIYDLKLCGLKQRAKIKKFIKAQTNENKQANINKTKQTKQSKQNCGRPLLKKLPRRQANKIRSKRALVDKVSTKFILTSFKAILDFINDDLRASMEMVSLTPQEFKLLKRLYGLSPKVVPAEEIFDETCVSLAKELFERLEENDYLLGINYSKTRDVQQNVSPGEIRKCALIFTKKPFKDSGKKEVPSLDTQSVDEDDDTDLEKLRNPKSILEKMCLISPVKTTVEPRRSGMSPVVTRSVESPTKQKSEQVKVQPLKLDDVTSDKPMRTPALVINGNPVVTMKAKLLEGLAVPLESEKAMRMMRLMGWNGGALGVRGEGLMEPIQPVLDMPKGLGLGHKLYALKKISMTNYQNKVIQQRIISAKITDTIKIDNGIYKNVNNDLSNNNQNINYNETASNEDPDALMKSKIETDDTEQMEASSWVTNESLLQKIKDKSTNINANYDKTKYKIETNTKRTEDTTGALIQKNKDAVKSNHEKLMVDLQKTNDGGHDQWRIETDEKLKPYAFEKKTTCLSDRMQFLVHLLDLLQSDEKSFTIVGYAKKPCRLCTQFIDSVVSCLDLRQDMEPDLSRYGSIMEVCTMEMRAHGHLMLSCRFKKKVLTLMKTDSSSNFNPLTVDVPRAVEFDIETIYSANAHHLNSQIPLGLKGGTRSKVLTNRIILEFVESADVKRVYDYGRTPVQIRLYVTSLASLLNRQMADYQLGLGVSEHPVFRKMLDGTKNFCLLFRFDTQDSYFNKLQLVKVDMAKRCRICQMVNQTVNILNQIAQPHDINDEEAEGIDDIDLYPNIFHDDNETCESDNNVTLEISDNSSKLNNEKDDQATDVGCTDEIEVREEYLIGEDWLNSDVNDETNTKDESVKAMELCEDENNEADDQTIQKEVFIANESTIEDVIQNGTNENVVDEEMSSDFHNWRKRIKKNETNNNNLIDDNMEWNAAGVYVDNIEDIPKRKSINTEPQIDEEIDNDLKLNASDNVTTELIPHETLKSNTKDNIPKFNMEEIYAGILENIARHEVSETDFIKETYEHTKDNTKEAVKNNAFKIPVTDTGRCLKPLLDVFDWPKNVLLVHYDYPKYNIDASAAILLQSIIYEAIDRDRFLPRIKCGGLKNGGIIYTCYDHASYIWLYDQLQWYYTILDYEQSLETTHIIDLKINTFVKIDIDVVFNNIEMFYENIKTAKWKVIQTKEFADYCVITIKVDDLSLKWIKKEDYSLFVGVDKADVSLIYD